MTFDEFLQAHHWIEFLWEIFKGVAPTIIALVTIAINARISKKKAANEEKTNQIKELQLMVSELSFYILEVGRNMLEAIQRSEDSGEADKFLEKYYDSNNKMLMETRKLLAYINIRAEVFGCENMKFTEVNDAIVEYSYDVISIHEWYNKQAVATPKESFENLCDEVQKKLIRSTTKVEKALVEYCADLANG